jgi:HCOMODA/2-hydroxy-3-carboxy-muconic semialdehyde decarboxylase
VVDAYGHVSLRHPLDRQLFLQSRSRSPELVEPADIVTLRLDGTLANADTRSLYLERYIHAAILRARPDITAVVHAHATEVLPYTIVKTPLVPVIQNAGVIGEHAPPVWDSADRFGDTNLLVVNLEQGEDLARRMGDANVVLMRGHGFAAAGRSLIEALRISIYLRMNAAVLTEALRLGKPKQLSKGEVAKIRNIAPDAPELRRAWEYWAVRAGCADLLR